LLGVAGAVALAGGGLTASFVDKSLRQYSRQDDWRATQTIAAARIDAYPGYPTNNWGDPAAVHVTHGTMDNWDGFSVQWDGWLPA
jgi:hypothetical protein